MSETALSIAATGMSAQQMRLEVDSNNIANINSTAYKAQRALFAPLPFHDAKRIGSVNTSDGTFVPSGIQIGAGVKPVAVIRDLTPGIHIQTNNDYHVAINGQGYFHIKLPSGEDAYTRSGTFTLDQDGTIVTLEGYKVQPEIKVPQNTLGVEITPQGEVMAKVDGQTNLQSLGNIELAVFTNPGGLEAIHDNYYQETQVSGASTLGAPGGIGFGSLLQHWYEGSNVNAITSVTDLIATQRAFEMNTKSMKAADEMMQGLKNI